MAGPEGSGSSNELADSMRQKAEARQRARLVKVFELMKISLKQRRSYRKGQVVFHQGDPADFFYIIISGELEMYAVACP